MVKSKIYYLLEEHDGPSSESYILKSAYFDINTFQFEEPVQLPHPSTLASKWCQMVFPQEFLERYQNLSNCNDNFDLRSVFNATNSSLSNLIDENLISSNISSNNKSILIDSNTTSQLAASFNNNEVFVSASSILTNELCLLSVKSCLTEDKSLYSDDELVMLQEEELEEQEQEDKTISPIYSTNDLNTDKSLNDEK